MKFQLYPNCKTTLTFRQVSIEQVREIITRDDVLRQTTENYRKAIAARQSAKMLKDLKAGYFPMLLPAARCEGGRSKECFKEWTLWCQCDLDGIAPERLDEVRRRLQELPFVALYHVSMGGGGLHVYYRYQIPNSGMSEEVYRQAFLQGNEIIANAVVADYDKAVMEPTHGSSLCHDPEAWFNPDAEPLKVDMTLAVKPRDRRSPTVNKEPQTEKSWPKEWDAERVFHLSQGCVNNSRVGEFRLGNRNNYLVALAMLLSDYGMDEQTAAQLMDEEYGAAYGEEPIPSLVRGCYRTARANHGMKQLPSLRTRRKSKGNGEGDGSSQDVKILLAADFIRSQGLRFDTIAHKIVRGHDEITDRDINSMLIRCNEACQCNISPQTFRSALMSDVVEEYNPLADYLSKVGEKAAGQQPGESAIQKVARMVHVTMPPAALGEPEWRSDNAEKRLDPTILHIQQLWEEAFRRWLVAMVASWLNPAVANQQMLILIGRQGIYKSTWLDALMPKELNRYRCRISTTDFKNKDEQLRCTEYALINYDEFDRLTDSNLDPLKQLITATDLDVRAPYGSVKEKRRRIASFCASCNKPQILTDNTGNRRFLPFFVESIDSPFDTPIPHDEMYAEAVSLLRSGYHYWFDTDEVDEMAPYVELFADRTPEEELLDVYFDVPRPAGSENRAVKFLTSAEILAKLVAYGNIKKPIGIRALNAILDKHGFPRTRRGKKKNTGFLVVELEATDINSSRSIANCDLPF